MKNEGKNVLALVPGVDDRYGKGVITSRIGLQREAAIVDEDTNILELFMRENNRKDVDCVVIDECQFLKKTSRRRAYRDSGQLQCPCSGIRS